MFTFKAKMEPSSFIGVIRDGAKCFCGRREREADFVFVLEGKRNELEGIKKEVEARIEVENIPDGELNHQLSDWRRRVELIQQEIKYVGPQVAPKIQNKCLSKWCSKNCSSSYRLGKNVAKIVDELLTEGKIFGKDFKFSYKILTEKEAFELFCKKVGNETLSSHPSIPKLAENMAKLCEGLPLALNVLGNAMAGVKSVGAWEHAINSLTSSSSTALDLRRNVFSILKFSYNKLDEVQKRCFLYCALYPKDYEFRVHDLIEKWIWEKFLCKDMTMSVRDMRGHGESVIEKLKLSGFLESVEDDLCIEHTVKLHDLIHSMAQDEDNVELVQGISIINDWESQKILDPPNAATLVLVKRHFVDHVKRQLEDIKYMKRLKVLELNVDGGEAFVEVGGLISLEYLSVYMTEEIRGRGFWYNLQPLTKLKFLSLEIYSEGIHIPPRVLSSLQQLRVLRLVSFWILDERSILEELDSLPNIEELWIQIGSEDGINKLLESTKLQSCIYSLFIESRRLEQIPSSLAYMSGMKQLHQIKFSRLNMRNEQYSSAVDTCFLANLRKVSMHACYSVTHATWLKYAPLLQQLHIEGCDSMEEVIKEEEEEENNVDSSSVFSSLVTLTLLDLPRLESIHKAPLPFPSLKSIRIVSCPNLKKLPL